MDDGKRERDNGDGNWNWANNAFQKNHTIKKKPMPGMENQGAGHDNPSDSQNNIG